MAAEKKRAEKTSFILGYMEDGNPITNKGDMVPRRFASTSFSHDEDSEKQQSESLRGSDADVFGEDGFLWGSGGFEMEVPLVGSLHILRTLLRDAMPVSTEIPDKTLVAAGTDLSDVVNDGYFTEPSTVNVYAVESENLRGGSNKNVKNDMRAFTTASYLSETEAAALTVTVSLERAALQRRNTNGTVQIQYAPVEGERQMETLTFANNALTTPQMITLPQGAVITRVRTSGFTAGTFSIFAQVGGTLARNPELNRPGRLRFKFSTENAGGQITVRGVRRVGLASDDTLPMREVFTLSTTGNATKDVSLTKYFHKINKVEVKDKDGTDVSSGTVEVISTPGGYETTLKMSNDLIELMMEAEVGGIPRKITRGEFTTGQLNISDTVRLVIDMLSKRVDKRSTIEGGDAEKFVATAAERPSEFAFVSEKFFPDWGGYMELDSEAFVFDSATVDINRNEDFSAGKRASRFRAGLESGTRRNVTAQVQGSYISGTSEEDKFIRWDEKFRNNEAVAVKIANYHWPTTGRQYSMEWIMEYCEVTSPVRVEATSPGNIPITVDLKAVPNPAVAGASELTVRLVSDDQWT
ncbi:hypothetical protein F4X10_06640 [Candidatus Poribacteria bacterium]|nr:hypothetical protein [Candidatus Poribacteria bacterium]MYC75431.1 hypothetical protein [Candidatus Poribacteria bacterium]